MKSRLFILGIVIFAIGAYFYITGYNGVQELVLKFSPFSPEKYQQYKMMETLGGVSGVIGILIALAAILNSSDKVS